MQLKVYPHDRPFRADRDGTIGNQGTEGLDLLIGGVTIHFETEDDAVEVAYAILDRMGLIKPEDYPTLRGPAFLLRSLSMMDFFGGINDCEGKAALLRKRSRQTSHSIEGIAQRDALLLSAKTYLQDAIALTGELIGHFENDILDIEHEMREGAPKDA